MKKEIKESYIKTTNFLKRKKVINIIIILLFLTILISSTYIRLQNLPLLIDQTSGEYIPLALDPYYFLRVAETTIEQGGLPTVDSMRYPLLNIPFINEILPQTLVFLYNTINIFYEVTLQFVDVIYPVIFFALGLIVFFFLVYAVTNSKGIALLSSAFLAFIPPYLYRTMAGFSDHESIGMFAFFSVMLIYVLAIKYLEKENTTLIKTILFSLGTSFLTVFTLLGWGGAGAFVFMIIPLSFFLIWVIKFKKENQNNLLNYSLFYILWVISTFIWGFILNYNISTISGRFTSSSGIIGAFVFGFIIIDSILYYVRSKNYLEKLKKHRVIYSALGTIVLGALMLPLMGKDIIQIMLGVLSMLLQPFGTERIALTVAENAQPFLTDWISQIGKSLFWISFFGMIVIGIELGRKILSKKGKVSFFIIWAILISSILFSKFAPGSVLNGDHIISKGIYLMGIILFLVYSLKIYFKDEIKLDSSLIFLTSLILISAISIKSASRVFFLIVPFACLSSGFFIFKVKEYIKNNDDESIKWFFILLFILLIIVSCQILFTSFNTINAQAKITGPSAHIQWQNSMAWVKDNTPQDSLFVHWWDYGYWIQYLGERPTITDGGHGNAFWDHLIARYVLTTPHPKSALSFMKVQNVSYLLIDQTDLGKYPAYSKIGGNKDYDTLSIISMGVIDNQQTIETNEEIRRFYNIGGIVDEDIIYNEIFLPGPSYDKTGNAEFKSYVGAIIIISANQTFQQPHGIFINNNKQISIPLRYIYFQGQIFDFGSGIDSIAYLLPQLNQNSAGMNIDNFGAVIYLSPKVSKSLFAQLYLLDDVFNNYPTVKLAHSELDPVVKNLKSQGANFGDFIYFNGFRGPIKIWKVDYPNDIITHEEFTHQAGEFAEFDYLF